MVLTSPYLALSPPEGDLGRKETQSCCSINGYGEGLLATPSHRPVPSTLPNFGLLEALELENVGERGLNGTRGHQTQERKSKGREIMRQQRCACSNPTTPTLPRWGRGVRAKRGPCRPAFHPSTLWLPQGPRPLVAEEISLHDRLVPGYCPFTPRQSWDRAVHVGV